jgi:PAS domain S-box-containing protein
MLLAKLRVLIADDQEESRSRLREFLQAEGYEVIEAAHGAEALVKARQEKVDLIIADLLMPVMDGYLLLRHWKADDALKKIPFVVYPETYTDAKDKRLVLDLGADDFILKPADPAPFCERIRQVLARAAEGSLRSAHPTDTEKQTEAKEYNEVLVRRLEEKALQLQESNLALQTDVDERKRIAEALSRSEDYLQSIVQTAGDAIVTSDADGKIHSWNAAAEKLFGYSAKEIIGRPINTVLAERVRGDLLQKPREPVVTGKLVLTQKPTMTFGLRRDGSEFPVEITASSWKTYAGPFTTTIIRDITERRDAEEKLRRSESQLANAAAIAKLGPWELDVADDTFTFNDQFYAIFRTNAAAVGGYRLALQEYARRFIPPEDADIVFAETRKAIETTDPNFTQTLEHRIRYADGSFGYVSVRNFIVKDANGKTVKTYGVIQDITVQKRTEEELRKRVRELEGMNRVSGILRTVPVLDDMLPLLLEETLGIADSECGSIWLFDSGAGVLRRAAARGWMKDMPSAECAPGEGFPGGAFSANAPQVSADLRRDARARGAHGEDLPEAWGGACVPIRSEKDALGVLCVAVPHPRALTAEEIKLLTTLSEMAGAAIQRIRLNEQTNRQVERLTSLHAIDTAITASLNLSVTISYFLDQVILQLGVDAAAVLLSNPRLMQLEFFAGRGFRGKGIASTRLRFGEGHAGRAALERRLLHVAITPAAQLAHPERVAGEGFVTHTSVPLVAKGQVKGILELFQRTPFTPKADWLDFLNTLAGQAAIAVDNATLFSDLQKANLQLSQAYDTTLEGWSRAMDLRDKETEGHSQRVTEASLQLARAMGLPEADLVHLRRGALLHDLGKLGVPDYILNKPAALSPEEKEIMRRHPALAYEMLMPIEYLRPALDIPYCHHERWDGSGYPRGLKGDHIPLPARIFAVVDVFDALTSDRPYRAAWTREKALEYIREKSGTDFDPRAVEEFLKMRE